MTRSLAKCRNNLLQHKFIPNYLHCCPLNIELLTLESIVLDYNNFVKYIFVRVHHLYNYILYLSSVYLLVLQVTIIECVTIYVYVQSDWNTLYDFIYTFYTLWKHCDYKKQFMYVSSRMKLKFYKHTIQ